jgi:GTPase SAR1 family protein
MSRTFEYDVFLSYSSKDKKTVHALAKRLKQDGLRVWLDAWVIQPGDSIPLKIQRGLEQSRTLLMCMSPAYFESEWGTLEHHTLLFRDPTNAQRRFIPLLIADCTMPDIIAQFAYIDWRTPSNEGYAKLLAACRKEESETPEPPAREEQADQARMVLEGHNSHVVDVTVTPDGKTVVSGSNDGNLKVWDLETGQCRATFVSYTGGVIGLAVTPDGQIVVSGSEDNTLKVWDLATGQCRATFKGHTSQVYCVAITPDGKTVVSGSWDNTLRVWDLATGQCRATFRGHTSYVLGLAITPDGKTVVSGSDDKTLKVWDLATGRCRATFKGHSKYVGKVVITPDGQTVVSGSADETLRVWDLATGRCRATFEGHTSNVWGVAVTPDGKTVISGSADGTLKVWDLATGHCRATFKDHINAVTGVAITPDGKTVVSGSWDKTLRVWDLSKLVPSVEAPAAARYTNAKVVLVGETGVGKTGLALRLCEDRWEPTESTHGMIVSRLELPTDAPSGMEREVWLWDFAGQPDYRLIHQLYMDETALGVLVFDPQDDNPFEDIGYWEKALRAATKYEPARLLVAARCDRGGITISRKRFEQYVQEQGLVGFLSTGAKTGDGCEELKAAIARHIPWERLPWTATSRLFKTLKDATLKLTEEDAPLVRLPELRQRLQLMLPEETIGEADLRAVVGLMQGQGVVQTLAFGDFVLLQPEWINRYASVVVRMAREHADEMGVVPEQQVLDGRLDYKGMKRLAEADEKILLRAMVQTFLDRSLCLREETPRGTMLVFPSYFRRDKPGLPEHPNVFVTYGFAGPLDEIYTTLVVRLSYSDGFKSDQLWKDAADFKTPGGKRVGLAMAKKAEGAAEIVVYFEAGVPDDTKVTFIKYVHEHLLARAQPREEVTRVRTYVCPYCDEPLENRRAIQLRLEKGLKDILCPLCEKRLPLLDLIEEKFASDEFLWRVRELDERARINLDNESRELILVGHAIAIAAEAGQIFRPVAWADWGIDGEIEFKDAKGQASGQRIYLQLKSGDSYLYHRERDDVEVFTIKKKRQAEYWLKQAYPVMLVIRTSDGKIRWMNVTDYLQRHGLDTRQIVFEGEPFTALNVARLRDKVLRESKGF